MKLSDIEYGKATYILKDEELKGLNNQGIHINNIDLRLIWVLLLTAIT